MFPNLYSCVKVFPFESVKTRCFLSPFKLERQKGALCLPPPCCPSAEWDVELVLRSSRRAPGLPRTPTGSFISPPSPASTLHTLLNLSLIYLIKQAFQEKNVKVPVGRREVKGGSPQNCKFCSTSLKTHTRAQGR